MSKFKLTIGIYGLENLYGGDPRGLIEVAQKAEAAGIDQLSMTDHVVMGNRTDRYPYGEFPSPPETPWLEPITTEAAIAAATSAVAAGPAAAAPLAGEAERSRLPGDFALHMMLMQYAEELDAGLRRDARYDGLFFTA